MSSNIGPVKLTYFSLGKIIGRGGAIRFLLQSHGIKFEEEKVEFSNWMKLKTDLIESGRNPFGQLPVVQVGDKTLFETNSIISYLTSVIGYQNADAYNLHKQNAIVDNVTSVKAKWINIAFGPAENKEAGLEKFKETLPGYFADLEKAYEKFVSPGKLYLGDFDKPLGGDCETFATIYDFKNLGLIEPGLIEKLPKLNAMCSAFEAQPEVAAW
eukprot:CAMPEP_0171457252 /NCGR_PEP_ID=MMETSP0945-20130129/3406_1 /TAXON_ID=109269 /ORGANISM="Vaucheria litorea, Strain CCMP2940" /LENGTH=212 /DNA_ID=CAMNT_0011982825 /DNA_START=67 /DNA_END=702 /DNA_ORIENTATION=+